MQAIPDAGGTHLVLYDGVCGLCDWFLQIVLVRDHRAVFRFASLQSPIGRAMVERFGGNPEDLSSFYVLANYRTPRVAALKKSRAGLLVAKELGWPWRAICVVGVLPTVVLDALYDVVARYRYRIFGRREQCLVPAPHLRNRFVD